MNTASTRVTLVHEDERLDMAARTGVPTGALVPPPKAHQPSGFFITTADGTVMDAEAVMRIDVLGGTVLITTPVRAGLRSYETMDTNLESALRASVEETTVVLVSVLCFFLGGLPPLIGHDRLLPPALQTAGTCLLVTFLVSVAFRSARQRSAVRETMGALTAPLTGGTVGVLLAPVSGPNSRLLVALLVMWGIEAAALLFWIIHRGASEAVSAGAWLFLSVVGAIVSATEISCVPILVVLMAVGAVGGLLIPRFAVQVPNQQLLDVTQLRVMGRSVHQPTIPPLRKVSLRSISRSVAQTTMSSVALEVASGNLVLLGLPTAIQTALADGVTIQGARVEVVCVMLLLLLHPRTAHSRALRFMSRLVVAIAIVLTLALLWIDGDTGIITRPWS